MNDSGKFLDGLKNFKLHIDGSNVPQSDVEPAEKIEDCTCEHFTFEGMKKKSGDAVGLRKWVINIILYYDVVTQVEPKRQALRVATSTFEQVETRLSEVKVLMGRF